MAAAFSHSLSIVLGKKACDPILLANALIGAAAFAPSKCILALHAFAFACLFSSLVNSGSVGGALEAAPAGWEPG